MNAIAPSPLRHQRVTASSFPPSHSPRRHEVVDWPSGLCLIFHQAQDVRTARVRFTNDEPPGEDWCLGGQDTIHAQGYEFLLRCGYHTIHRSLLAPCITWEVIEDYCFAYEAVVKQWWDAGHRLSGVTQDGSEALLTEFAHRTIAVPNRREVEDYLREHPDLTAVLRDFCLGAVEELGSQNEYVLSLFRDRDSDSRFLVLNVRAPFYPDDFYGRLEAVQARYYDRLGTTSGWVILDSDFQGVKSA